MFAWKLESSLGQSSGVQEGCRTDRGGVDEVTTGTCVSRALGKYDDSGADSLQDGLVPFRARCWTTCVLVQYANFSLLSAQCKLKIVERVTARQGKASKKMDDKQRRWADCAITDQVHCPPIDLP